MNDRLSRIGCDTRGKSKPWSEDPNYLIPLHDQRADSFYSERYLMSANFEIKLTRVEGFRANSIERRVRFNTNTRSTLN